jgi:hypothetical protein
VEQPSGRSDGWPTLAADDEVVEAIAAAQFASSLPQVRVHGHQVAVDAWRHAGVTCANHLIDRHPELVEHELADVDTEWNTPCRIGPRWLALIAGYRDTLREYAQRGADV